MSNLDFSFLDENLVYKILTRKSGHLNSFKNVEFIMTQDNLEVFFDYPELSESLLIDWFDHFEIIQDDKGKTRLISRFHHIICMVVVISFN